MARATDDDEFERAMEGLGAKASRPARAGKRASAPPAVIEDIDFEAAMREIPDGKSGRVAAAVAGSSPAPMATTSTSPTAGVAGAKSAAAGARPASRYEATADEKAAFLEAVGGVAAPKEGGAVGSTEPAIDVDALVRRVRRGQIEPDASLDLHGKSRQQALDQVRRFVAEAQSEKWRVVRIVVGKGLHSEGGDAVVGPAVEQWLADGPALEIARAPTHLGGAGALLVVLRLE